MVSLLDGVMSQDTDHDWLEVLRTILLPETGLSKRHCQVTHAFSARESAVVLTSQHFTPLYTRPEST